MEVLSPFTSLHSLLPSVVSFLQTFPWFSLWKSLHAVSSFSLALLHLSFSSYASLPFKTHNLSVDVVFCLHKSALAPEVFWLQGISCSSHLSVLNTHVWALGFVTAKSVHSLAAVAEGFAEQSLLYKSKFCLYPILKMNKK